MWSWALGCVGGISHFDTHPGFLLEGGKARGRLRDVGWEEETQWGDVGVTAWLPVVFVQGVGDRLHPCGWGRGKVVSAWSGGYERTLQSCGLTDAM